MRLLWPINLMKKNEKWRSSSTLASTQLPFVACILRLTSCNFAQIFLEIMRNTMPMTKQTNVASKFVFIVLQFCLAPFPNMFGRWSDVQILKKQ